MSETASQLELHVSPQGKDSWSGRLPEPNAEANDGPLATLGRARDRLRELKQQAELAGPVTVWVHGGRYELRRPVEFGPEDSWPVTYAAAPGETPVFDGGVRVKEWATASLNGRTVWAADVRDHLVKYGPFHSFFVNNQRCPRPRLPKADFYWMADVPDITLQAELFEGSNRFICKPGEVQAWANLTEIEAVVYHYWIAERLPLASFDPQRNEVRCAKTSRFALKDDFCPRWAKYYLENVKEALTEPGEWYLDRGEAKLYYLPRPGETPENVEAVIPVTKQFLRLIGSPAQREFVDFLAFRGLAFQHADWEEETVSPGWADPYRPRRDWAKRDSAERFFRRHGERDDIAAAPQANFTLPGTVFFYGARHCRVEDCRIERVGYYAIQAGDGCRGLRLTGNTLYDLGGGGIMLDGADASSGGGDPRRAGDCLFADNHIHGGGRVFPASVGVLILHAFGNRVMHNEIHDFYYSGVSVGWVWGYAESVARDNHIEFNHIYDLGKGVLSDMGGIYLLGVHPGARVANNLIHDIYKSNYGGWAIYTDEGSSHVIIEDNVCYSVSSQPFHQHYGRENVIRNNIFACGAEGQLRVSRDGQVRGGNGRYAIILERNIIIGDGQPALIWPAETGSTADTPVIFSQGNLFWDLSGKPVVCERRQGNTATPAYSLAELQKRGLDVGSIEADPRCRDPRAGDFTLAPDSPALALGFRPIDLSRVGPRLGNR